MNPPVNILWTGGWDSTFCVLDFLLRRGLTVQPLYIIDPQRASTSHELAALDNIRRLVGERFPDAAPRLLETRVVPATPAGPDDPWLAALQAGRAREKLGDQYAFIARTVVTHRLAPVWLAVESPSKPQRFLAEWIEETKTGDAPDFVLSERAAPGSPARVLFGDCHFPLIRTTKLEMERTARQQGWIELLKLTWFCHQPRPGKVPCGCCNPCRDVVKHGLGWRLPLSSRLRQLLRRHVREPWKRLGATKSV